MVQKYFKEVFRFSTRLYFSGIGRVGVQHEWQDYTGQTDWNGSGVLDLCFCLSITLRGFTIHSGYFV